MFSRLHSRLASGPLPAEIRMIALAIALLNLPGALFGGFFFWTLIPLPGLVIYGFLWSLVFNKGSVERVRGVGIAGMIYNLSLLLVVVLIAFDSRGDTDLMGMLSLISFLLGTAGLYGIMLRILQEKTEEDSISEV